jgi:hypothetical protein
MEEAERAGRELVRAAAEKARAPKRRRWRYRGRVTGKFGKVGRDTTAWVLIDKHETLHVRTYRGRRLWSMPLARVAEMVLHRLAIAEARQTRVARKHRRAR